MSNRTQDFGLMENPQKTDLQSEIENWEVQIDFTAKETDFYLKLVKLPVLDLENTNFLLQGLSDIKNTGNKLVKMLLQHRNNLEGLNECDDLQCETYYLDEHDEIRAIIDKHQLHFRAIKSQIFAQAFGD